MQFSHLAKEQPVFGHGVVDAGARKNQPVVAAKARNQDSRRHEQSAHSAEHLCRDRGANPVLGCVLDSSSQNGYCAGRSIEGERAQINKIAGDVQRDHDTRTQCQS